MTDKDTTLDETSLADWIGKTRSSADRIDSAQANRLRATVNPTGSELREGDTLPAGWHWAFFLEAPGMNQLGRDGHAALGDFLPPVALAKRMWAGTRLRFHGPIYIGDELTRTSEVTDIVRKTGSSGELCFVTVKHKYLKDEEIRLEEDHHIVYRGADSGASGRKPPAADTRSDEAMIVSPSTTLLFRYSALTFNGHRIHYDLEFCKDVEGYPGLVVHAPLTATLMLALAEQYYAARGVVMREFNQRSVSPLFHDRPFTIRLREGESGCDIWAENPDGRLAATATIALT